MRTALLLVTGLLCGCSGDRATRLDLGADIAATSIQSAVTIDVFSGRPNPVFELTAGESASLQARLNDLHRTETQPSVDALGYRGFHFQHAGTTLHIGGGIIVVESQDGTLCFKDSHGAERVLIEAARKRGYGNLLPL